MQNKQIGVLAGIVGILSICVQYVPSIVLDIWIGGESSVLPMIGTIGATTAIYNLVPRIVGPLFVYMLAVGLGYYLSTRIDIAQEYRRVGSMVAIGSSAPVAAAFLGATILSISNGDFSSISITVVVLYIGSFIVMFVSIAAPITVGALAGAAIASFRLANETPSQPTEAETDSLVDSCSESRTDDPRSQSQSPADLD
ncbi:hypothetical protein [Halomontanus rarus]|uniref:hypothetical protein n=1 Tax=Halomontanus rarus TaxID=3034020 RepID=UPI0023E8F169|nr:hypothetical protein [Halovivax sp. TS33]